MATAFSCEDLGLTREKLNKLISDNCPVFYLDTKEKYGPCSVHWFLEHARLVERGSNGQPVAVVQPKGRTSQQQLLDLEKRRLALWLDDEDVFGPELSHVDDVPVYAHIKAVCWPDNGIPEALEITYMTLFAFNGAYPLFGCPCLLAGHHQGDWEHCTVRLRLEDYAMTGVWYNSHRSIEGEWSAAKDVPRDSTGRIASYVARNGHGHYPRAGVIFRIFFAASDFTSANGCVWHPKQIIRMCGLDHGSHIPACTTKGSLLPQPPSIVPEPEASEFYPSGHPEVIEDHSMWQRWSGSWGTSYNPPKQSWFYQAEPPVSRTSFQRLFCPLAKGVDSLLPRLQQLTRRHCAPSERLASATNVVQHVHKSSRHTYDTCVVARPTTDSPTDPGSCIHPPTQPAMSC